MKWVLKQGRNSEGDRFRKRLYVKNERVLCFIEEPMADESTYLVWSGRDTFLGEFLTLDAAMTWCEERQAKIVLKTGE